MKNKQMKMGELIKEYRIMRGMTQIELSKLLGFSTSQFISLIERDLSKTPLYLIGKMHIILDIPEKKLIEISMSTYEIEVRAEIEVGKKEALPIKRAK